MEVALAGVADYASFKDGTLTVVGFRRMVTVPQLENYPLDLSFQLMVVPSSSEIGQPQTFYIEIVQPDGRPMIKSAESTMTISPPEDANGISWGNLTMRAVGIVFPAEGKYLVKYWCNGAMLCEFDFGVVVKGDEHED